MPMANISQGLAGRLPGLISVQNSGQPGADQASMTIRGAKSGILYIVDGVQRSINDIDPNDVESVSLLKDGAAVAVYGLEAAGGVMIVTTKKGPAGDDESYLQGVLRSLVQHLLSRISRRPRLRLLVQQGARVGRPEADLHGPARADDARRNERLGQHQLDRRNFRDRHDPAAQRHLDGRQRPHQLLRLAGLHEPDGQYQELRLRPLQPAHEHRSQDRPQPHLHTRRRRPCRRPEIARIRRRRNLRHERIERPVALGSRAGRLRPSLPAEGVRGSSHGQPERLRQHDQPDRSHRVVGVFEVADRLRADQCRPPVGSSVGQGTPAEGHGSLRPQHDHLQDPEHALFRDAGQHAQFDQLGNHLFESLRPAQQRQRGHRQEDQQPDRGLHPVAPHHLAGEHQLHEHLRRKAQGGSPGARRDARLQNQQLLGLGQGHPLPATARAGLRDDAGRRPDRRFERRLAQGGLRVPRTIQLRGQIPRRVLGPLRRIVQVHRQRLGPPLGFLPLRVARLAHVRGRFLRPAAQGGR